MNDRTGQQLGNYRLTRLLGRGGFAEVYLGEHVYLQNYAAIKVLSTHLAPENTSSFLAEARTLARLVHPQIVRLLDFGIENATPFLVMDYAVNGTLRLRHPRGVRVPLNTVVNYVNQIANALQYAHNKNIIHRDIKPANMLLGQFDEILLADFGIAIILDTSRYLLDQDNIGTIAYMSPEQIQSHPRTASDQYSLAVVVYEWLCGELPFIGTFTEIAAKHCQTTPPPLREKAPTLPPAVEQVVLIALKKEPKDRFATISAFATALAEAASLRTGSPSNLVSADYSLSPPFEPTGPSRPMSMPAPANRTPISFVSSFIEQARSALLKTPRRNAGGQVVEQVQLALQGLPKPPLPSNPKISRRTAIIGLATAGVVGAGGLIWWSRSPHQAIPKPSNIGNTITTYAQHNGPVYAVSWSPDKHNLKLASSGTDVQVWNATSVVKDALSPPSGSGGKVNAVAWSPDNTTIAYSDTYKVTLFTTSGQGTMYQPGDLPKLYSNYYGSYYYPYDISGYLRVEALAWSPDSTYIAAGYSDNNVRVWKPGRSSSNSKHTGYAGGPNAVMWSPVIGNTKIAYGSNGSIRIVDELANINNFSIPTDQANILSVAWSSDGTYIAAGSERGTVQVWKVSTAKVVQTYDQQIGAINAITWSPKGHYIASGSADGSIHVWDAITGKTIYVYTEHKGGVNAVAWSPDGQYIASASDDTKVKVWYAPPIS